MTRKIISLLLALMLCISLAVCASAAESTSFLYDEADLLTAQEEAALTKKLAAISSQYEAQLVIVTLDSLDGGDIDYALDYLYDSAGFGYGDRHDGVLLLICMDIREYRILSNGYAGVAIDPDDISYISDEIVTELSAGDYYSAFEEFADECAYYLDGYINGFPFDAGETLMISLIIGVVIGLIVTLVLKGQLKTVRSQYQANVYVKPNSMKVDTAFDFFLYRNVSRTKRESDSSSRSGGGSRSRGGGSF